MYVNACSEVFVCLGIVRVYVCVICVFVKVCVCGVYCMGVFV